jgi:hypothetical protein
MQGVHPRSINLRGENLRRDREYKCREEKTQNFSKSKQYEVFRGDVRGLKHLKDLKLINDSIGTL